MTLPITAPELLVGTMETLMDKAFLFDHKWEKELIQDCRSLIFVPPFWAQILQKLGLDEYWLVEELLSHQLQQMGHEIY